MSSRFKREMPKAVPLRNTTQRTEGWTKHTKP